jgi:outer membrane protein
LVFSGLFTGTGGVGFLLSFTMRFPENTSRVPVKILTQLLLMVLLPAIAHADFGLMLGSFKSLDKAQKYADHGIPREIVDQYGVFVEEVQVPGTGRWHRVLLGPFTTRKAGFNTKKAILAQGFRGDTIVVKCGSNKQNPAGTTPEESAVRLENTYPEKKGTNEIDALEIPLEKSDAAKTPEIEGRNTGRKEGVAKAQRDDQALAITVEKATLLALENNYEFRLEMLEPDVQRTYEDKERAAFDPVVRAEGGWSRQRDKVNSVTRGPVVAVGASEFFPTGTWADLEFGVIQRDKTFVTNPDEEYETDLSFTVTQALLRGRGLDVNLASLRQARLNTRASEYELRGLAQTLLAEVENAYWDYTLARESVKIYEASLRLGERLTEETRERIALGQLAVSEIYFSEAEVATRLQDLINAQSVRANARLRLLRLMNAPDKDIWKSKVELVSPPVAQEPRLDDVGEHIKVALLMRPDLNQARLAVQKGELEIVKTKNGLLPRLDFFVSLGRTGYADSFGSSVNDFASGEGGLNFFAGLRFEFPIGNRAPKALHKRSMFELEQEQEALNNMAQLVEQDVLSAFVEINRSGRQISAAKSAVTYQKKKLEAEIEKYRLGKSTMFRVAQAERDLVESQILAVQANIDYLKSFIQLYLVEGSLLVRRGISAPGREPVQPGPGEN